MHKPIAKVFYLLKLPTLSIGNVALWRSGSRNLATSMMEVIVTIVNNWLIVIYYHKDFHHRCCSGLRSLFLIQEKKLDSTGFSHSKLKHSLPQNWIYCFFFDQSFLLHWPHLFCYKSALSNKPALLIKTQFHSEDLWYNRCLTFLIILVL